MGYVLYLPFLTACIHGAEARAVAIPTFAYNCLLLLTRDAPEGARIVAVGDHGVLSWNGYSTMTAPLKKFIIHLQPPQGAASSGSGGAAVSHHC